MSQQGTQSVLKSKLEADASMVSAAQQGACLIASHLWKLRHTMDVACVLPWQVLLWEKGRKRTSAALAADSTSKQNVLLAGTRSDCHRAGFPGRYMSGHLTAHVSIVVTALDG